jgi:hypothetical protein
MGFSLTLQALTRPPLAEAKVAAARAAGREQHPGGPATQGIFDKGRRQQAAAEQGNDRRVGCREQGRVGAAGTGKDDHRLLAREPGEFPIELPAQRIDRLLRHVDAGNQGLRATKRRRRRA